MLTQFAHQTGKLFRTAAANWVQDKAPTLGAALAFYSILSLAPLLVIAVAMAALFFDREAAQRQLVDQLQGLAGEQGAAAVGELLKHARQPAQGILATSLGLLTLLLGASGVFGQLQEAMNVIWKAPPAPAAGIADLIRRRFLSFAMVLGSGFLLLVSLVLSAAIAGAGSFLSRRVPALEPLLHLAN